MTTAISPDLTDTVLDLVAARPGLTLRKIAKALRADAGQVRRTITYLVEAHYVAQRVEGGRETYRRA